jgi:peptidoglycan/xylan/chitin deacetylase (PgdA/CDA1 family)
MTKEELVKMLEAGWELAAHTYTHRDLTLLSDEELKHELVDAKANIESDFGTEIISFAYPYGKFDERVKEEVGKAGYKYAVVIDSGGLHLEEDSLEIFRVYMFPEDGLFQIRKKSASWYRSYFRKKRGR